MLARSKGLANVMSPTPLYHSPHVILPQHPFHSPLSLSLQNLGWLARERQCSGRIRDLLMICHLPLCITSHMSYYLTTHIAHLFLFHSRILAGWRGDVNAWGVKGICKIDCLRNPEKVRERTSQLSHYLLSLKEKVWIGACLFCPTVTCVQRSWMLQCMRTCNMNCRDEIQRSDSKFMQILQ